MTNVDRELIKKAGSEWLKLQFATSQEQFDLVFSQLSTADFLALSILRGKWGFDDSRVYLKDIAAQMHMPMPAVSARIRKLQDRGLLYWKHDEGGTYVRISEIGMNAMAKQEEILVYFIEKTIERYGYEQFIQLLELRKALNVVMDEVVNEL